MAIASKPFYKSWSFWLLFITFLLAIGYIRFGGVQEESWSNRVLYGGIFWASVLILNLLYLLFTKEEVRDRREKNIKDFFRRRKEQKIKKAEASIAERTLRKKFYDAKKTIKNSAIYSSTPYSNYELPWYLVMGQESSKKASILRYSGLDFPVNINYKDSEYEDNKDDMSAFRWFFSEESVFINVPSSYVSVESDRLEKTVWNEFLRLFKKERWQRPVNGIILTLRVEDFLSNPQAELQEYAKVLRTRFDELSKAFFSDIPIYVVISGLEKLTGFYEFFNTLTAEEKREILGVTFEEKFLNINADTIALKFSELQERLEGDRIDKLHREWSVENRVKAYFFNDEFRALLGKITIFTSQVFSKTRYHAPLMLRGIYFTSIDDAKQEHLGDDISTKDLPQVSVASSSDMPKGMFLPRVFERIILSESNLVKIDEKFKKKYGTLQALLGGVLFIAIIGLTTYWSLFIVSENKEVRSIEETIRSYNHIKSNPLPNLILNRVGAKKEPIKQIEQIGQLGGRTGSANVNFASNDAKLSVFAKAELKTIANKIKLLDPTTHIKIFGYTDNVGDAKKNLELSLKRAKSIKAYFVSQGVEKSRLFAFGKGSASPIATNDTVEGRSLNRRVEIFAYGVKEYTPTKPSYKESYKIKFRPQEWREIIATLETLCDIGADDENKASMQIWKPGFYKVVQRNEWVTKLYHKTLNSILLDRVALIIKRELLNNLEDRKKTVEALTAYLLLNNEKRRAEMPDYLRQYMLHRWGNLSKDAIKKLNKHFDVLLNIKMRKVNLDQKAIKRARASIMTKSGAAGLYYKTLKDVTSHMNLNKFQFNQVLTSNPQAIRGGDKTIAGIYTKKGYKTVILPKSKEILKAAIEANWILGKEGGYSRSEFKYLHKQILDLYFADYRKEWSEALAKISIPKYVDPKDLTEQLALFSSPASPIVDILRAVKENTYILTQQEVIQKEREEKSVLAGKLGNKLNKLTIVKDPHKQYKLDLRETFKGYHKLIDKNNLPSRELMPFQTRMEEVYAQVLMVQMSSEKSKSALEIVKNHSSKAHSSFKIQNSFIPPTVTSWYNGMLQQNWEAITLMAEGQINKEFITEIWDDYSTKIANRFPLDPKSENSIEMEDFVAFFGKDGILDNFYKKNVEQFMKDINYKSRTYKIKEVDGSKVTLDKALIDSMFNAHDIQTLMFDEGGVALEIAFNLTPITMADIHSTMEVQYEDQLMLYEHGPKSPTKFSAPGASKTSLAKFTLYDFDLKRVVKVRGRDEWALLRLLYQLNPKVVGKDVDGVKVKFSYNKDGNSGSFELKGKSSNIFSEKSPLLAFKLSRKGE